MKIGFAADHAGQRLKGAIVDHLKAAGHTVVVYGPETTPDDDYPLIVRVLADAIARGDVERGIFTCGSGIAGIRAAVVDNEWSGRDAVQHVDLNLLTLGERVIGAELAKSIVDAYLSAQPEGGRHERRRKQIEAMEPRPMTAADAGAGTPAPGLRSNAGMRRGG